MKVIDLLNKIAKGEDIPNKIKFDGDIFVYNQTFKDYEYPDKCGWLMDISRDSGNNFLNDEVEIIEEEKDIEKLNVNIKWEKDKINYKSYNETGKSIARALQMFSNKIDELVEEVNKLKNKEDK